MIVIPHSAELLSFIGIILLMIISPGANQVLVLQSGMTLGHRAAAYNVIGVASYMLIHALFAGFGISVLIMQSPELFSSLKGIGSAYIMYLAIQSLISGWRLHKQSRGTPADTADLHALTEEHVLQSFRKGFVSNILNVQTSFIFLSIFPQYMNQQHNLFLQSFFLTGIFIVLLLAWYTVLITLIATVRERLLHPRIQVSIKTLTGSLLLIMAIRMFPHI